MNASLKKKAPLCATEPTVPVSPPPPIPRKGPPAAAEGHSRPLSPPGLSCSGLRQGGQRQGS